MGVLVGSGQPEQLGEAGDLGQPRRRRTDVGGRTGDVYQQHATSLTRHTDNPPERYSSSENSRGDLLEYRSGEGAALT
ncbi:hypothetical protein GCM10027535_40370 [Mycolicibacterium hippocampi]